MLVLYLLASLGMLNAAAEKYSREDDLERLDRAIEKSGEYTAHLFHQISSIESMLYARGSEGRQQYDVYRSLFDIYKYFQFDKAFYITLNLAWGGDWGGMWGVDEGALPATMRVDYVRVFQKKK